MMWNSHGEAYGGMHGMMQGGMGTGFDSGMAFGGAHGFIGIPGIGLLMLLGIAWALAIKGYALWHAAKRNESWWFFFLLIINTFGIFELVYLIFVAKVVFNKKKTEGNGGSGNAAGHHHDAGHSHEHKA